MFFPESSSCLSLVAVLYARADSVYKALPGCDVFDLERDARNYRGNLPVIAHPPCRLWGRLRTFSTAPDSERLLAFHAVEQVRRCGGVLEHPASSTLWAAAGLSLPGRGADAFGGWTLPVLQSWWGHSTPKATWLYVVGVEPRRLPSMPFELGAPVGRVASAWSGSSVRDGTPFDLANWLFEVALLAGKVPPKESGSVVIPGLTAMDGTNAH